MRKFALFLAITFNCVCLSAFAQEADNETVNSSEVVTNENDVASENNKEVAPHHDDEPDCGCGGKPKA